MDRERLDGTVFMCNKVQRFDVHLFMLLGARARSTITLIGIPCRLTKRHSLIRVPCCPFSVHLKLGNIYVLIPYSPGGKNLCACS